MVGVSSFLLPFTPTLEPEKVGETCDFRTGREHGGLGTRVQAVHERRGSDGSVRCENTESGDVLVTEDEPRDPVEVDADGTPEAAVSDSRIIHPSYPVSPDVPV